MSHVEQLQRVRAYWDEQAKHHGEDVLATMPDRILKELEIQALLKRLPERGRVLDVGCGNGYSTLRFARERRLDLVGVDYSEEMIQAGLKALEKTGGSLKGSVRFEVGDVLRLAYGSGEFDVVMTDRCLINLTSLEDQRLAFQEIHRVLKPAGQYLMCEDTQEGLAKLNQLRTQVELYEIPTRWHNLYLSEAALASTWTQLFALVDVDQFSSLYYIASRIFNAKMAEADRREPQYDHLLNRIAAQLPSIGEHGPLKLFVFKKPWGLPQRT